MWRLKVDESAAAAFCFWRRIPDGGTAERAGERASNTRRGQDGPSFVWCPRGVQFFFFRYIVCNVVSI